MSELYDNLLKATNNIDDITTEKYATVTKLNGNYCDVKEEDTGLEHTNVPIVNGANLSVGDKVIIGFLNNSIYDVVCYGALNKTVHDTTKQDKLISGENIKTINNNSILGSGNLVIEGGGTGVDIVTEWETTTSDSKVASEKLTKDTLDTKVDKENGKGLSSNDFTNNYKSTMDSLKTVATTGDYDDLLDKPNIPSKTSDLSDGSDLVKKSSTSGLLKNDGSVDTNAYITSSAITGKEDASNKVTSWSSTVNDTHYPTEKLVKDSLDSKQATLVSGTNIKTINNQSLLGSGNISVSGGGGLTFDDVYPVGSIYMSANDVDPSTLFGGTWQRIEDKFLLASGTSYSNGATGGSADAVVVQHTHPVENTDYYFVGKKKSDTAGNKRVSVPTSGSNYAYVSSSNASFGNFGGTKSSGESGTGKNMPPYIVVNVWKRTA